MQNNEHVYILDHSVGEIGALRTPSEYVLNPRHFPPHEQSRTLSQKQGITSPRDWLEVPVLPPGGKKRGGNVELVLVSPINYNAHVYGLFPSKMKCNTCTFVLIFKVQAQESLRIPSLTLSGRAKKGR